MEVPKSVLENLLGMQMADDPNINFGAFPQPFCSEHVVSFQTSATTSGSGGMPAYLDCSSGMDTNMGMLITTPSVAVSTSSSNMIVDSGQNLKYGGPLAAEWSYLELQVLKDGLEKYVNEQGIMKYIKIAASLPTKTVRDVAMRCQWLGYIGAVWLPASGWLAPAHAGRWCLVACIGVRACTSGCKKSTGARLRRNAAEDLLYSAWPCSCNCISSCRQPNRPYIVCDEPKCALCSSKFC